MTAAERQMRLVLIDIKQDYMTALHFLEKTVWLNGPPSQATRERIVQMSNRIDQINDVLSGKFDGISNDPQRFLDEGREPLRPSNSKASMFFGG